MWSSPGQGVAIKSLSARTVTALVLALGVLLGPSCTAAQADTAQPSPPDAPLESSLTPALIESKIKEVEASSSLTPEAVKRLVEQYRVALSNIEELNLFASRAASFRTAIEQAPRDAEALRAQAIEQRAQSLPADPLPEDANLAQVEQQLAQLLAEITAVEAKLAELDKVLDENAREPTRARKRITEANRELDEVNAQLSGNEQTLLSPLEVQAQRWALETARDRLRAEVLMLDQQLLSTSARSDLNLARRTLAEQTLADLRDQRALLENEADRLRQTEAERLRSETADAERDLADAHPLVRELARENTRLSAAITELTERLNYLDERQSERDDSRRKVDDAFRSARQRLEAAGLSRALGQALVTQYRQLPDASALRTDITDIADRIAETSLNLVRYRDQLRRDKELEQRIAAAIDALPPAEREALEQRLRDQLARRDDLLHRLIAIEESYLRAMSELDASTRALMRGVRDYRNFLSERLLWVRSVVPISEQSFADFPAALAWLSAPNSWRLVVDIIKHEITTSPLLWIGLTLVFILLVKGPALRRAIRAAGEPLRRVGSDKFAYTMKALVLTLILALPWSLLLALTGWRLEVSTIATPFSIAIGSALAAVGFGLYYLRAFHLLCLPGGVADRHFRWSSHAITQLRTNFRLATLVLTPLGLIAGATVLHPDPGFSGTLGRLALVALILALAVFTVRLTNPTTGVFRPLLLAHPKAWLSRLRMLWYPALIAVPVLLALLALAGYLYTSGILLEYLISELWLILSLVVVHQLIVRWLILTRRSLALQAALDQHISDPADDSTAAPAEMSRPPDSSVNLAALDEQTRRLINSMILVAGAVGVWLIWSDALPALGLLDRLTLWHYTATVDGLQTRIPVTLADLGRLLLIISVALIAGRNLPALLEIILLRHTTISPGMRYTLITLTGYSITAAGALLVFSTLGLSWSQVQWLVAALSVGIGFGLQEIVANFISGLIILFERPIRVGDVVTVGDTTGMVTRIQIRATTIRNWDKQELLVPNKEFITGRLLNWSLTDKINRMTLVVGAEYGCDTRKALALLAEAAAENPRVLEDPAPLITFEGFGDNSLTLVLRYYLGELDCRLSVTSELHQAIADKFRAAGIGIAFPQRDIHLHASAPIPVALQAAENRPRVTPDPVAAGTPQPGL
ncbi:Potassium efflux system KefA precursor [Thiorhodovibrio winogradskyi]|uniref:Potassium efflux system KefA n=1 Tax=Thiorhodovibrio winogradskyi TaxID=77007 RepID=A0ABZ0S4P5_9GAMM|nr:mechanosensitive ion channel domain-containing protein [Thiorhodovibrio winogradskyi]